MRLKGAWPFFERKDVSLETIARLIGVASETVSGVSVTPSTCEQAPTVKAIVKAVSDRFAVLPLAVYRKTTGSDGREKKEKDPSHPVAKLLQQPSETSTAASFWADAAGTLIRHGNFICYKGRGSTGPIRFLQPILIESCSAQQHETGAVVYKINGADYLPRQLMHARGSARNFYWGDSIVNDVREAIAAEIAAERFGAAFFGNGALPLTIFKHMQGSKGFRTQEDETDFIKSFQEAFTGSKRFRGMVAPPGMDVTQTPIDNDKAQFIETRKYLRTVIAGAFNCPLHIVGDLENAHYNNMEQADADFTQNVILPLARTFETTMERDLLTQEDRNGGVIIRFNLDAVQRADLASRTAAQVSLLNAGALNPNEQREMEGRNPISDKDGGNSYRIPAGVTMAGQEPAPAQPKVQP